MTHSVSRVRPCGGQKASEEVARRHGHLNALWNVAGVLHIPGILAPGAGSVYAPVLCCDLCVTLVPSTHRRRRDCAGPRHLQQPAAQLSDKHVWAGPGDQGMCLICLSVTCDPTHAAHASWGSTAGRHSRPCWQKLLRPTALRGDPAVVCLALAPVCLQCMRLLHALLACGPHSQRSLTLGVWGLPC